MERNNRLAKNTIIYFIGNLSTKLLSFLLLPLYTTYLTPHDYGQVDLIYTYTSILMPIITMQITFAAFRFLFDTTDEEKQKTIISNAFFVHLIGLILLIIVYTIIWLVFKFEFGILVIVYLILNCIASMLLQLTRGLGKNSIYAVTGVVSTGIQLLSNIVFIVGLGMRSKALLISPIIAFLVSIVFVLISVRIYKFISLGSINKSILIDMLKYSIPLIPDAICWWLLLGFGRMWLSNTNGLDAVGIYSVANKFPSMLMTFYSIFNMAWQENSFSEYNKKDRDSYYSETYNQLIKFLLPIIIIAIPATKIISPVMIGDKFGDAYMYIPILYISSLISMLSTFYGAGFESAKKTNGILVSTLLAMIVTIIGNIVLTKSYGIYGVSLTMCLSYVVLLISRVRRSKEFFTIRVDKKNISILSTFVIINFMLFYIDNNILQFSLVCIGSVIFFILNRSLIYSILNKANIVKGKCTN